MGWVKYRGKKSSVCKNNFHSDENGLLNSNLGCLQDFSTFATIK